MEQDHRLSLIYGFFAPWPLEGKWSCAGGGGASPARVLWRPTSADAPLSTCLNERPPAARSCLKSSCQRRRGAMERHATGEQKGRRGGWKKIKKVEGLTAGVCRGGGGWGRKKIMKRSVAVGLAQVGAGKGNIKSKHSGMHRVERLAKTTGRGAARWEVRWRNGRRERRRRRRRRNFKVYIELAVAAPEDLNRIVLALPPWPINVKLSGSREAIRLGERKTH